MASATSASPSDSRSTHVTNASLRDADATFDAVVGAEKASYLQMLDRYSAERRAHPTDVTLLLAQCKFSERFTYIDDLNWGDLASKDLRDCRDTLQKQFPSEPEAALFELEHRFGNETVAFGTPLVAPSAQWTPVQRARLHASLSRGYDFQKNSARGGQEAVIATELDPASERLDRAMRYLAVQHREKDAGRLLEAAPLPKWPFQETMRLRTATEVLPAAFAIEELHRAQSAGIKVDAYTTARVLQHGGDAKGADAVLLAQPSANETPQNQQLRLDVAFDAKDAKAAADVIAQQSSKNRGATFVAAYIHLVHLDPSVALRRDLLQQLGSLLSMTLIALAAPGLVLFPVHYRGTVRQRVGKITTPIFERIGLRHAWYALAVFFVGERLISMMMQGTAVLSSNGSGVVSANATHVFVVTNLWVMASRVVLVLCFAKFFDWRDLPGRPPWKARWFVVPALVCVVFPLVQIMSRTPHSLAIDQTLPSTIFTHGAIAMGGVGLAFLALCVIAPVTEEIVFRGVLLGGLSRHLSFGWANLIQALTFAAFHADLKHFVFLTSMGLVTGFLVRRTRGFAMSMLGHSLNNLFVLCAIAYG